MGEVVAIIPARGGSKGVPGKNVKVLGDKPLIGWGIDAAKKSGVVDRVVVSTDDEKIARAAESFGAEIIWERKGEAYPYNLATESYLRFAVDKLERFGIDIDLIVFIQPTSPFLSSDVVKECVEKITKENYDSSLSVYETMKYFGIVKRGEYLPFREVRKRRQEMIPWYCDNGAIYVIKNELFKHVKNRYGGKIAPVLMSEEDSIDIDEPSDWWLAEQLVKKKKMQERKGLIERMSKIKLIAMDFDGVLTDNLVIHGDDGKEAVIRSRADSLGIDLVSDSGYYDKENYKYNKKELDMIIMSRESNPVVKRVAEKIKIKCSNSVYKKYEAFIDEVNRRGLKMSEVLFLGNDLNDLDCIKTAGIGVAVADSHKGILDVADYVTNNNGGNGALREILELYLLSKKIVKN